MLALMNAEKDGDDTAKPIWGSITVESRERSELTLFRYTLI